MSHCTKFTFQYTDRKCIIRAFESKGLIWKDVGIGTSGDIKWRTDEYTLPFGTRRPGIAAKQNGINYLMEKMGKYYELSMEKHNMSSFDKANAKTMAEDFKWKYVKITAELFKENLEKKGINCLLDETKNGWAIRFGKMYEKSVLINFDGETIEEKVVGVKGKSCQGLTEALENMLSSPEVDLHTRWTEEYNQSDENELKVFTLGTDD